MKRTGLILIVAIVFVFRSAAQTPADGGFKLALPEHQGQLRWSAPGFKIIQSSAKPGGREMGIRGKDGSGRLTFLGFLFLFPEQAPLTNAKCRDGVLDPAKKSNPTLKVLDTSQNTEPGSLPVSIVSYTSRNSAGKMSYVVRGFVATGDICGDLEVYSDTPITADDAVVKPMLASYRLNESYTPQFDDVFLYAQLLYQAHMYKAAAPMFEAALVKLAEASDTSAKTIRDVKTTRRIVTDQAGMAYGMSGEVQKARSLFEKAIVADPDYPLNYYNLACADAEEKNLTDARTHLQQAFARKENVIAGEVMPDPTKDDSFLPYRDNKEFWAFLETVQHK